MGPRCRRRAQSAIRFFGTVLSRAFWLVERYGETERFRLDMRPGMTGPMQVHGRGELNFQELLAVEREYVENYSLRKDIKILVRTFFIIIRGQGAY